VIREGSDFVIQAKAGIQVAEGFWTPVGIYPAFDAGPK
jgi:hypothetical protein